MLTAPVTRDPQAARRINDLQRQITSMRSDHYREIAELRHDLREEIDRRNQRIDTDMARLRRDNFTLFNWCASLTTVLAAVVMCLVVVAALQ